MILRKHYLEQAIPFVDQDLIKIFTGIRRSGKTVLMKQMKDWLLDHGRTPDQVLLLNMESLQVRRKAQDGHLYEEILSYAKAHPQKKLYLFFDEIQDIPEWQLFINSLRVDINCDLYITGSNATLLSNELATCLSGRYIQIPVYPFSLKEAKEFQKQQGTYQSDEKLFQDYLRFGGFPQRFYLPDASSAETYLRDLFEAVVLRDVLSRHKIRDTVSLQRILAFVLDNIGNPFSARKISGMLTSTGIKTTVPTVLNQLQWFQEAFIIEAAPRYDIIGKELLTSTEKYYAADLGLRNAIKSSEKLDVSKLYENLVYLEMRTRGYQVRVGKLKNQEIDFICQKGSKKLYIQVAYLLTPQDMDREFGNLKAVQDNYPKYVISSDPLDMSQDGIIHKNILEFLLES
ncbi:ATP-binding protein [Acidaminococcus massiliensis]|jgi:predicted AAA+ superfamily ATPase|uniref:ATP-binding protein n=1 Tax=Acidaminococcus massiliensis TaxID=1852375 RepID=UPI0022E8F96E|nr:ATP-binding protein [Acidaminococcus massiliensis]